MNREQLRYRCSDLGVLCIKFSKELEFNFINKILLNQLIRSTCSVGANYSEALESESRKDFIHKVLICKKELKESLHWLYVIEKTTNISKSAYFVNLSKEVNELLLIFSKTVYTSRLKR